MSNKEYQKMWILENEDKVKENNKKWRLKNQIRHLNDKEMN